MSAATSVSPRPSTRLEDVNLANDQLMRATGSPDGFDPIAPSQYLHFLNDPDPLQRLLAFVRSKTIRKGYRCRYCVDEHGNPIVLEELAVRFGWSMKHARCTWARAESRGLVRMDEEGRLYLRGDVPMMEPPPEPDEPDDDPENLYRFFPAYVVKQIQQLSTDDRNRFLSDYQTYSEYNDRFEAEAIAQARAVKEELAQRFFGRFGIEVRRNKKQRVNGEEIVKLSLTEHLPEKLVQVLGENPVQPDSAILYTTKNGTVQDSYPYISSETEAENYYSSSSFSVEEPEATTTKDLEPLTEELPALLVVNGKGALTPKQSQEVGAAIGALPQPQNAARSFIHYLKERIHKLGHAGAVPTLARGEFTTLYLKLSDLKAASAATTARSAPPTAEAIGYAREILLEPEATENEKKWAEELLKSGGLP